MNAVRRSCFAGLGALSFAFSGGIAAAQSSPVDAVNGFYAAYARQPFTGQPSGADWSRVARHMSAPLAKMIRAAQSEQARCQKAHPDEKPPWIEGDMFTSNFEGFTRFKVSDSLGR